MLLPGRTPGPFEPVLPTLTIVKMTYDRGVPLGYPDEAQ